VSAFCNKSKRDYSPLKSQAKLTNREKVRVELFAFGRSGSLIAVSIAWKNFRKLFAGSTFPFKKLLDYVEKQIERIELSVKTFLGTLHSLARPFQ
jgi:hypothetical protein